MELLDRMGCKELLSDVVCYEICCGRLSPEMEYLIEEHLEKCPSCRNRAFNFRHLLRDEVTSGNFG